MKFWTRPRAAPLRLPGDPRLETLPLHVASDEDAKIFNAMLRLRGIKEPSITEPVLSTPACSRMVEAIIEIIDEFYLEHLSEDLGWRKA